MAKSLSVFVSDLDERSPLATPEAIPSSTLTHSTVSFLQWSVGEEKETGEVELKLLEMIFEFLSEPFLTFAVEIFLQEVHWTMVAGEQISFDEILPLIA